jgi:hypothetical protein
LEVQARPAETKVTTASLKIKLLLPVVVTNASQIIQIAFPFSSVVWTREASREAMLFGRLMFQYNS